MEPARRFRAVPRKRPDKQQQLFGLACPPQRPAGSAPADPGPAGLRRARGKIRAAARPCQAHRSPRQTAARVNSPCREPRRAPGSRKGGANSNTSPQETRPASDAAGGLEPAGVRPRPSGSASSDVAAQPRLQPQNPPEGERKPTATQEPRKEQVLAEPKAPPATVRPVEPESERSIQSRPASEPEREVAPKATPEVTKKPTPNSKEEEEKAQKAKEQKEKEQKEEETQPEATPPK